MNTTHIVTFRLGRRVVQFSGDEPAVIADGDQVAVAGLLGRGMIHADAIHNLTTRTTSHVSIVMRAIQAPALLAGGVFMLALGFSTGPWGLFLLAGCAFLLGALMCLRVSQTRRALAWVRAARPGQAVRAPSPS